MPKINVLPKNVAELIAAGEVVERPASVIKELIENSVDAGATQITVEIQRGGITYIRIADNGCGIERADVPTAFLRHATSKIKSDSDLYGIATLGFRGEALAAISSVARVEMLTCTESSNEGSHYVIEGGEEILMEAAGCPKGTTIIVRDIFYNTPARMKFLKKDVSEANACTAVVERIALSHPEIAFKLIRDGKQSLSTAGDGSLKNCVYSVLGRDFAGSLIEVSGESQGVRVSGLTCKPVYCRATRNSQFTFLNGRLVRSGTVIAAVEQAYKNSAMIGKFPGFVLFLSIPFDSVDVNVHPAKTEVRFSDEKRIFDSVYSAVKNAIAMRDTRPQVQLSVPAFNKFEQQSAPVFTQQKIEEPKTVAEEAYPTSLKGLAFKANVDTSFARRFSTVGENVERVPPKPAAVHNVDIKVEPQPETKAQPEAKAEEKPEIYLLGEAFSTYIVVQMENSIFMIDKHAAHERILYNELISKEKIGVQALLTPVTAVLDPEEYDALIGSVDILSDSGFEIEDFGNCSVIVRAIPAFLTGEDVVSLLSEVAGEIITCGRVTTKRREHIFHTVACRAAVKAGNALSRTEMLSLSERVLYNKDIMYCPHGRPVAFEIKKRDLEKQFGRIQ